jgi:hypothetical protein
MIDPSTYLIELGIAGVWIISLLYDKVNFHKKIGSIIEQNNKYLVLNYETIKKCSNVSRNNN